MSVQCNHARFDADCSCCAEWLKRQFDALGAEAARLRKELARWRSDEAVVQLREALRRYGTHDWGCPPGDAIEQGWDDLPNGEQRVCSCGLDAALRGEP